MFDTVHLCYKGANGENLLSVVLPYLANVGETTFQNGTTVCFGDLRGAHKFGALRVKVDRKKVKIQGSISKYLLGHNVTCIKRTATQQAIEQISDALHLPIREAQVTRLDISSTLQMKYPIEEYISHIGTSREFPTRLEAGRGLYVRNKRGELCFYDKSSELKKERPDLAEAYLGLNLLRLEQRYLSGLARQFKRETVPAALLYDDAFYTDVVERWANAYNDLNKMNSIKVDTHNIKTRKDMNKAGCLLVIEKVGGLEAFLRQIDNDRKRGIMTSQAAFYLKEKAKEAVREGIYPFCADEAIQELNEKVLRERDKALGI